MLPWSTPGSLGWTVASRHAWHGSVGRAQLDGPLAARWTALYERHMGFVGRMLVQAKPGDGTSVRKWPVVVVRRRRRLSFEPQDGSGSGSGQDEGPGIAADRRTSASEPETRISEPSATSSANRGVEAFDQRAVGAVPLTAPEAGSRGVAAPVGEGLSPTLRPDVASSVVVEAMSLHLSASEGVSRPEGQALQARRRVEAAVTKLEAAQASLPAGEVRSGPPPVDAQAERTAQSPAADDGERDSDLSPPLGPVPEKAAPHPAGGAQSALGQVMRRSANPPMGTTAERAVVGSAAPNGTPAAAGAGLAPTLQRSRMAPASREASQADVLLRVRGDVPDSSRSPSWAAPPRSSLPLVVNRTESARTPADTVPQGVAADSSTTAMKVPSLAAQVPGPSIAAADAALSMEAPGNVLASPGSPAGGAFSIGERQRIDVHTSAAPAELLSSRGEALTTGPRGVELPGEVADMPHRDDEPGERAALLSVASGDRAVASTLVPPLQQAALPIARVAATNAVHVDTLHALPAAQRHDGRLPIADASAVHAFPLAVPSRSDGPGAARRVSLSARAAGASAIIAPAPAAAPEAVLVVRASRGAAPPMQLQHATGITHAMNDTPRANDAMARPGVAAATVADAATSFDAGARLTDAFSTRITAANGQPPVEPIRLSRATRAPSVAAATPAGGALAGRRVEREFLDSDGERARPQPDPEGDYKAPASAAEPSPSSKTGEELPSVRDVGVAAVRELPALLHAAGAVRVGRVVVPATTNTRSSASPTSTIRTFLRAGSPADDFAGGSAADTQGPLDGGNDNAHDSLPVVAATRAIASAAPAESPWQPTETLLPRNPAVAPSAAALPHVVARAPRRDPGADLLPDAPAALQPLPSETLQHGVVPARIGVPDGLLPPATGGAGGGQDIDEVVERALQVLMQRLEIERERRGFAKWH